MMPLKSLQTVLKRVRGYLRPPNSGGVADAQLLERFLHHNDEAAFELLVWRHGPMVLGTCRRVLRHQQDAEDAFQATFFTLARKGHSIGRRESVSGWLYTVAHRIALRARQRQAARGRYEGPLNEEPAPEAGGEPPAVLALRELRPLLDAEIGRLPEKYRAAFVLCYLEGKTNEEAAEALGCPKGTVLSRLARARERLRRRLTARNVALAAAPFAALLAQYGRPLAEVSPVLVTCTAHAALLLAVGKSALALTTAPALELSGGMVRAMAISRLRLVAGTLGALALLALSARFAYSWVPPRPAAGQGTESTRCHGDAPEAKR